MVAHASSRVAALMFRRWKKSQSPGNSWNFDWAALPQDGRYTILASTSRLRYGPHARATWRPSLHLALWNPYQALDIGAPALLTYGFAPPALDAVGAWLAGEIDAAGQVPVPGFA